MPALWTARENQTLRSLWGTMTIASMVGRIGRTHKAIASRARLMKLPPYPQLGSWT